MTQREAPAAPADQRVETTRAATTSATAAAAPTAPPTGRRGVERLDPAATRRPAGVARGARADLAFEALPADDAAIPFDRVPYVPSDLRRVAVMAAVMVVLIIVANLLISHLAG